MFHPGPAMPMPARSPARPSAKGRPRPLSRPFRHRPRRLDEAAALGADGEDLDELAHRRQMNHSEKFWQEVKHLFPDYLQAERWLKQALQRLTYSILRTSGSALFCTRAVLC